MTYWFKKNISFFVKIAIALFAIFFLNKSGLLKISSIKSVFNFSTIAPLSLLIFISIILSSLRWFLLLRSQKIKITFLRCLYIYYVGFSFNFLLPGGVAGDVIKIQNIIKGNQTKKSVAGLSVIVDRLVGLMVCALIILIFVPTILLAINPSNSLFAGSKIFLLTYYFSVIFLILIGLLAVSFFLRNKLIYRKLTRFFSRRKGRLWKSFSLIFQNTFSYRKSKLILILNLGIACLVQILMAICLLLIAKDILPYSLIKLSDYNLASVVAQVISIVPISPGGIGVGETVFAKVLYHLNGKIILEYASIYLTLRVLHIFVSIPGVIFFLLPLRENWHNEKAKENL